MLYISFTLYSFNWEKMTHIWLLELTDAPIAIFTIAIMNTIRPPPLEQMPIHCNPFKPIANAAIKPIFSVWMIDYLHNINFDFYCYKSFQSLLFYCLIFYFYFSLLFYCNELFKIFFIVKFVTIYVILGYFTHACRIFLNIQVT